MLICGIVALIVFFDLVEVYAGEFLLRQNGKKFPADLQRSLDGSIFSKALVDEFTFERATELKIFLIDFAQFFFTDDGCERADVLRSCISGVKLSTPAWMIFTRAALADTVLHQTGKARQYGHRRVDAREVQFTSQHDLAFGNVTGKIRHWVGNVIVGHGQDRDLCDRALAGANTAGAFIHRREIAI